MVEKKDYNFYLSEGSIKELTPNETKIYLEYLKNAYKEDLEHSKQSLFTSPKWSIIAGYYSMHNISKFYLGLCFNKKITVPDIHNATIIAMKKLVNNNEIKQLIEKLENFSEIEPLYIELIKGKEERAKTQYYINEQIASQKISLEKSNFFLNNIVEKYILILEEMIKNAK